MNNSIKKPILTVDITYFSIIDNSLHILLIKREKAPYQGSWALPGGYVHCDIDSDMNDTARRVIRNVSKIEPRYLEQVETIASNSRDPRGWTATVLFLALVSSDLLSKDLDDTLNWVAHKNLSDYQLAFDHRYLIEKARERLISKSRYTSMPLFLLPEYFTLSETQLFFEISANTTLEKKSFRRRMLDADIIQDTGNKSTTGKRKAALFKIKDNTELHFFPRMVG